MPKLRNIEDNISSFPKPNQWEVKHIPAKRIFDILFSLIVLFIGLPLFSIIALLVSLTSAGGVIYSQERIGRGGRPFKCYKFRTMFADAEERLQTLLDSDPTLKSEWEKSYKLKNDPRITPIGAFLRKTSIDEIPQFWNVLKGDLSVVGPRPVVYSEMTKYFDHKAKKIFSIRPGLTGLWQISGRSDLSYPTRIQLDEQYVNNLSFFLDLSIIAKTIPIMISSRGAY